MAPAANNEIVVVFGMLANDCARIPRSGHLQKEESENTKFSPPRRTEDYPVVFADIQGSPAHLVPRQVVRLILEKQIQQMRLVRGDERPRVAAIVSLDAENGNVVGWRPHQVEGCEMRKIRKS